MAKYPTINAQHEYITVNFGNSRRLTTSYSGEKASGAVPAHVFDAWCALTSKQHKEGGDFLTRIKTFVDSIGTIWPDWNVPPKTFEIGQEVQFNFGARQGGVRRGKVVKKNRTTYTIDFGDYGKVRMAGDLLSEAA